MLVDDSISRGASVVASTAPGEKGGEISLLDLPMERDGRELPTEATHIASISDGDSIMPC